MSFTRNYFERHFNIIINLFFLITEQLHTISQWWVLKTQHLFSWRIKKTGPFSEHVITSTELHDWIIWYIHSLQTQWSGSSLLMALYFLQLWHAERSNFNVGKAWLCILLWKLIISAHSLPRTWLISKIALSCSYSRASLLCHCSYFLFVICCVLLTSPCWIRHPTYALAWNLIGLSALQG